MARRNTSLPYNRRRGYSYHRESFEESDPTNPRKLVAFNAQFLQWLRLLPDELKQLEHYFNRETKPTVRLEAWHDPSQQQQWENREQKMKSEHDERCAKLIKNYEEQLRKAKESLERDKDDLKRQLEKSEAVAFEKDEQIMALKRKLEESQEHVIRSGNLTKDMERKRYDQELWQTKQALEEKEKELERLKERLEVWHDPSQHQQWENREQKLKSEHDERCAKLKRRYDEQLRDTKESLKRDKDGLKRRLEKCEAVAFEKDEEIMTLKRKLEEAQELVTRSGNLTKDMERNGYDQELWKTKQALEEKEKELERLKERHAAISERRVRSDQRKSENTLSANRQSQLEGEYVTDFKDGARVDAVEAITKSGASRWGTKPSGSDLKNYRFACFIFETAYECALNAKNAFAKFTSTALEILSTDAPKIGLDKNAFNNKLLYGRQYTSTDGHIIQSQDALAEVMVLVKEQAKTHDLTLLINKVKNEVDRKWIRKNDALPSYDSMLLFSLEEYIKYCTKFAWCLVSQVPPLQIEYRSNSYNSKTHVLSQAFSFGEDHSSSSSYHQIYPEAQKTIMCYLWPTLQDCEGRVIIKGEVLLARY